MKTPKLTLIRGLPGSGKSTLAKSIRAVGNEFIAHREADMFFMSGSKYEYDGMRIGEAHQWCQDNTRQLLSTGYDVIVSNTFTTLKELRPYFEIAKELGLEEPQVITCQGQFGSIHNVPYEVVGRMAQRFVWDLSPLYNEFA